jgi:hypothetical protein
MTSRTAEGKHTKRFIVLKKGASDTSFTRSYNIPEAFATRELAEAAIVARRTPSQDTLYKVRQK